MHTKFIDEHIMRRDRLKTRVWKKSDKRCHYCRRQLNFRTATLDHKTAQAAGGEDCESNTCINCQSCNTSKGSTPYDVFMRGVQDRKLVQQWKEART